LRREAASEAEQAALPLEKTVVLQIVQHGDHLWRK
jgi:hypothetical protein